MMLSFKEYVQHKPIPSVLFGIGDRRLVEDIKTPEFYEFIGRKDHPTHALQHPVDGVAYDPHSKEYIHFKPNGSQIKFKDLESAQLHLTTARSRFTRDIDAIHAKLRNHYQLESDDIGHILTYTDNTNQTKDMNEKLTKNLPLSANFVIHSKRLNDALHKYKTPDNMVVYSGTNREHAEALRNNTVVKHPAFLSTSLSVFSGLSYAHSGKGDIIAIHLPKDHPGAYVGHHSSFASEKEFLLPTDITVKLHRDKEQMLTTSSGSYTIHHATIEKE